MNRKKVTILLSLLVIVFSAIGYYWYDYQEKEKASRRAAFRKIAAGQALTDVTLTLWEANKAFYALVSDSQYRRILKNHYKAVRDAKYYDVTLDQVAETWYRSFDSMQKSPPNIQENLLETLEKELEGTKGLFNK